MTIDEAIMKLTLTKRELLFDADNCKYRLEDKNNSFLNLIMEGVDAIELAIAALCYQKMAEKRHESP